jgi:hypothetical protein
VTLQHGQLTPDDVSALLELTTRKPSDSEEQMRARQWISDWIYQQLELRLALFWRARQHQFILA